jgi:AcrR family transcriptional regulator
MAENGFGLVEHGSLDPRIRRTRLLLHQALEKLLVEKEFDKISVQDIAEAATLNRATFYDHYADKYALLECVVAVRFSGLLAKRGVGFDGGCASALRAMVLGVCDYLAEVPRMECERQMQMEPHMEAAVISVVRRMLLEGLEKHRSQNGLPSAFLASAVSWAMFGAAKEWVRTPGRCSSDAMADDIMGLLGPMLSGAFEATPA